MSLFNRLTYWSAVGIIFTFFLSVFPASALADCVQKRKTPKAPGNILKQANPLQATPENISAGEKLYQKKTKPLTCAQCHGTEGDGKGKIAVGLTPKPRDFSCQAMMKDLPDGQLFWIIKNGSRGTGMMAYRALKDDQIWQIVSYIRQFSK